MEEKNLETNEHNFSPLVLTKGAGTQKGVRAFLPTSAADKADPYEDKCNQSFTPLHSLKKKTYKCIIKHEA